MSGMTEEEKNKPVKGWAEILYLRKQVDLTSALLPGSLTREDYAPVGSWLPLEEYVHTFDIVQHLLGDVEGLANIPRPIRAYDAITMCATDPLGIVTVILVPKVHKNSFHHSCKIQVSNNPNYDVALINAPQPFDSFRYPGWPWKYMELT